MFTIVCLEDKLTLNALSFGCLLLTIMCFVAAVAHLAARTSLSVSRINTTHTNTDCAVINNGHLDPLYVLCLSSLKWYIH